jgi:diguanylate cyclase (GGDEF)-like protein/PAS domain S-box-containing protein
MTSEFIQVSDTAPRIPRMWRLVGVAVALACLDLAASVLNMRSWTEGGVTILWPSNGLLVGVLLCASRRQWPAYLAVGFVVDLGINLALSFALGPSAYIAGCNMLEVTIAAALMYKAISPKPDLTERKQLVSLLLYGVIMAPAIASFLAQLNESHSRTMPLFTTFKEWFTADALGIALVTPLYLSFSRRGRFSGRSWLEITGLFALLGTMTIIVFSQARFPVLFLLVPCLLILGVRLGLAGSAMGLLVISIVGGFSTSSGRGPMALMITSSSVTRDLILQMFVAVSMLILYIIEVVTAERKRLQGNLKASEARFRLLAEASNDVIILSDLSGSRRYVSPAAEMVLGWEPEELVGGNYTQVVHPDDVAKVARLMEQCREGKPVEALQYRVRKKSGDYLWMEPSMRVFRDSVTDEPIGFVNVVRDISNRKAAEDELNKAFRVVEVQARLDGLTGVANRRRLDEDLEREWLRAGREGTPLSLLLIDIDYFKPYNDIYGHLFGDRSLRAVAEVAQKVIHRAGDLVARYGGEEFVVVLSNTDSVGAKDRAEQIRRAVELLAIPHTGNPHDVVTVSIGCATQTPQHGSAYTDLVHAADGALYRAKSAGRNRVEVAVELPVER